MQTQINRLAFLGLGSMAGAILQGLLRDTRGSFATVQATCKSAESAVKYKGVAGVQVVSLEENSAANTEAVKNAQVIVLGVKPWLIAETLAEVAVALPQNAIVISLAAGTTLATMRQALAGRDDVRLVRAMPNTPAFVGKAVTGIAAESGVESAESGACAELLVAEKIFQTVGDVLTVPETKIDALSTVSGSGPAYLFWFVEEFIAAAKRLGFNQEEATLLAQNTVIGASELLAQAEKTAAELREAVTSPNGTTEQALKAFNAHEPAKMFDSALNAALARAKELAAG